MCWKCKKSVMTHIEKSTEETRTFKLLLSTGSKDVYQSPYHSFKYHIGDINELREYINPYLGNNETISIYEAFHSYAGVCEIKRLESYFSHSGYLCVSNKETGNVMASFLPEDNLVLCECIIPAGSEIYINDNGEVASDKIVVINATPANSILQQEP